MAESPRQILDAQISEAAFTRTVIGLAKTCGWLVYHSRPARTAQTVTGIDGVERTVWVTPMMGDVGFPDILALKGIRQVVAELKRQDAPGPRPAQVEWLEAFKEAGAETFIWRPSDFDEIKRVLGEGRLT